MDTFLPDRMKQAQIVFLTLIFLAAVGLTVGMLRWDHPKDAPTWGIFWISLVLWSIMSGLGVYFISASFVSVSVDADGLTKRWGGRTERVSWKELVGMHSGGTNGTSWDLHRAGGATISFSTQMLSNRHELQAILQARRAQMPHAATGSFRHENRFFMAGLTFFFAIAIGALAIWQATTADPRFQAERPLMVGTFGFVALLMLVLGFAGPTAHVTLMTDRLAQSSLFGKKTFLFTDIDKVELMTVYQKGTATEFMKLRSGKRRMWIPSTYDNFSALRDEILAHVPSQRVVDSRKESV